MAKTDPKVRDKIMSDICTAIACGMSLREWLRNNPVANYQTIMQWLIKYPDYANNYTRAREMQGHYYADMIADIVTSSPTAESVNVRISSIQRNQIDALKWMAGKRLPKVYGDRHIVESRNVDKDGNDVSVNVTISSGDGN